MAKTTKFDNARNEMIKRLLANEKDDGRFGRAFEVECQGHYSRKTGVAVAGKADIHILIDMMPRPAECKTNGGRVESLYAEGAPKWVIYRMDAKQKRHSKALGEFYVNWEVPAKVIPTNVFLAALERHNAVKSTNGTNPERAIQVFNRGFWEWLRAWPIEFEKGRNYHTADFAGLD